MNKDALEIKEKPKPRELTRQNSKRITLDPNILVSKLLDD